MDFPLAAESAMRSHTHTHTHPQSPVTSCLHLTQPPETLTAPFQVYLACRKVRSLSFPESGKHKAQCLSAELWPTVPLIS